MRVEKGSIVSLIGANGAGKTTILNTNSGMLKATEGETWFQGTKIDELSPQDRTRRGIVQIPEGRRIFAQLTVLENLKVGAYTRKNRSDIKNTIETVFQLFPRLQERRKQRGDSLSGGEQQMLAIGRALMASPTLLLMDEPSLGLSPLLCQEVGTWVVDINRDGVSVILVEQNARMALRLSQWGYVLEKGKVVLEGTGPELMDHDHVKKAYLGG